jgi:hypothetical protein
MLDQLEVVFTTSAWWSYVARIGGFYIIDLIVLCTRGQSGFSRWLIGSTADRVVRGASVPVLLVRAAEAKI